MTSLLSLYQLAESENIPVDCFALESREALSVMDTDGNCYIAIDPFKLESEGEEIVKLAHEMGHCITGSFYNQYSQLDVRQRHENRADRWAIKMLIPRDELYSYYKRNIIEPWELAEQLNLPEDFVRKAMEYYHEQDLAG